MQNFTDGEWRPPEGEVFADDAGRSFGRFVLPYLYWVVGIRRAVRGTSGLLAALLISAPTQIGPRQPMKSHGERLTLGGIACFCRVSTVEEFLIT
jgi:hypothetical protein